VAEPGKSFAQNLITNRNCKLDFRALWDSSDQSIEFFEDRSEGYLSVASKDKRVITSNESSIYKVKTVTLLDMLTEHEAPRIIEYISVDIEGSELRVCADFFARNSEYSVKCWTVEHNFRSDRGSLKNLFLNNGYKLVNENLSHRDYWFIKEN